MIKKNTLITWRFYAETNILIKKNLEKDVTPTTLLDIPFAGKYFLIKQRVYNFLLLPLRHANFRRPVGIKSYKRRIGY
jgi:hypothetical protein